MFTMWINKIHWFNANPDLILIDQNLIRPYPKCSWPEQTKTEREHTARMKRSRIYMIFTIFHRWDACSSPVKIRINRQAHNQNQYKGALHGPLKTECNWPALCTVSDHHTNAKKTMVVKEDEAEQVNESFAQVWNSKTNVFMKFTRMDRFIPCTNLKVVNLGLIVTILSHGR